MIIRRALLVLILVAPCYHSFAEIEIKTDAQSEPDRREQAPSRSASPGDQDRDSIRQSLPPDQKKSLHGLGPDDIFPGAAEASPPTDGRRRSSSRTRSSPRPAPIQSPLMDDESAAAATFPTPTNNLNQKTPQSVENFSIPSSPSKKISNDFGLSILGLMSLATLIGLVYTLVKLRDLLRDR